MITLTTTEEEAKEQKKENMKKPGFKKMLKPQNTKQMNKSGDEKKK